jgi:hypothetical protein
MIFKHFSDMLKTHPDVTGLKVGWISLYGLSVLGIYYLLKRLKNSTS